MIISNSRISLESQHEEIAGRSRKERLRVWTDSAGSTIRASQPSLFRTDLTDQVRLSARSLALGSAAGRAVPDNIVDGLKPGGNRPGRLNSEEKGILERAVDKDSGIQEKSRAEPEILEPRLEMFKMLIEKLTGEKVIIYRPPKESAEDAEKKAEAIEKTAQADQAPEREGWGIEYEATEIEIEAESTSFSSSGAVETSDGRRIAFETELKMTREHVEISRFSFRAGDAVRPIDPLVINFDGTAAELTDSKIDFDLDADGDAERISFVRAGSGFLAIDKNGDGAINDGSELFGPRTGDGFAELAEHDGDGNGWIDEGDDIYASLRVWSRGTDGADQFSSLAQRNVGALYLNRVNTPFELKDADNQTQGAVKSTSIYLKEDGGAGHVQQIDLVS